MSTTTEPRKGAWSAMWSAIASVFITVDEGARAAEALARTGRKEAELLEAQTDTKRELRVTAFRQAYQDQLKLEESA